MLPSLPASARTARWRTPQRAHRHVDLSSLGMNRGERMAMAVGVMTSWNADPAGPAKDSVGDDISFLMAQNRATLSDMVDGLISLAGQLLVDLECTTGKSVEGILRHVGSQYSLE